MYAMKEARSVLSGGATAVTARSSRARVWPALRSIAWICAYRSGSRLVTVSNSSASSKWSTRSITPITANIQPSKAPRITANLRSATIWLTSRACSTWVSGPRSRGAMSGTHPNSFYKEVAMRSLRSSHVFTALVTIGAILMLLICGHAQESTVSGTLTDQTGAVLPGVTVTATHTETGNKFEAVTD